MDKLYELKLTRAELTAIVTVLLEYLANDMVYKVEAGFTGAKAAQVIESIKHKAELLIDCADAENAANIARLLYDNAVKGTN